MKRVSELVGMDIFNDRGQKVGKIFDVVLDMQKGEVVRLALEPIYAANKDEAKRLFRDKTILYRNVRAVEKIVITTSTPVMEEEAMEPEPAPTKPPSYSYRSRYQK